MWRIRISKRAFTALPRVQVNTVPIRSSHKSGAVWWLQGRERDLDANIIALRPGGVIEAHAGPDLDV